MGSTKTDKVSTKKNKKKKIQMPGPARAGIGLLIVGAIIAGAGQYTNRGALSVYGFIMAATGFILYMAASFVAKRKGKI
jgi:hypothetical protein